MPTSSASAAGVRLRPVEDADVGVLFGHQADPVAAGMAAVPSRDRAQFEAHVARIRADPTVILRAVVADGVVAGLITSWEQDGQRLTGYWIGREHWGRGIASEALVRLLAEDRARPIRAHVAVHNAGSIRVLTKAGFRRDHDAEEQAPPPADGVDEFVFVIGA